MNSIAFTAFGRFLLFIAIGTTLLPRKHADFPTDVEGCENNLLRNGEVVSNRAQTEDMRAGTSDHWSASRGTPQVVPGNGCSDSPGYLQMWGNKVTGEGAQTTLILPVIPDSSYEISACIKFWNDNPANYTPYTRVVFRAINSASGKEVIIGKIQTSNESWETYTLPVWTPREAYNVLEIYAENDNTGTNSASWAHVDGICLTKTIATKPTGVCKENIVQNGEIITNRSSIENMREGTSDHWSVSRGTPQVGAGTGCSVGQGYLQMWGNRGSGEGAQTPFAIPVIPANKYSISACVKFWNDNPQNYTPYIRVVFRAFNPSSGASEIVGKIQTSNEQWDTYTLPEWIPSEQFTWLEVYTENDNTGTNSASWGHIDNICLQKIGDPSQPLSIETEFGIVCAGDCIEFSELGVGNRKAVWKVSDGRTIENTRTPSICFDAAGEFVIELLAVDDNGDTSRGAAVPLTIKPALSLGLKSFAVTTDTIGAVIKVPIMLSDTITSAFNGRFSFDPEVLDYAGAFDESGNPIDVGSRPEDGDLMISGQLNNDSLIGYMYFNLYWEKEARCRSVQSLGYSLTNTSIQCLSNNLSYELCLDEACGTPILSKYVQASRIGLNVAPNPASTFISLSTQSNISEGQLAIADANGKTVISKRVELQAGQDQVIDISSLNNGVYFISLNSGEGNVRKSIVIRR